MAKFRATIIKNGHGAVESKVIEAENGWLAISAVVTDWDEATRATHHVGCKELPTDQPWCPNCGSQEFQIVEDVPRAYRDHELVDGVLVFNAESQEVCWDGCGCTYQYLECRECQHRITDVPFSFESPEGAHCGFDEDDGLQIAIFSEGGLVEDVYCTNRKATVEVIYRDDMEVGDHATDEEIAEIEAEEERRSNRVAEIIESKDFCCVH